MNQTSTSRSLRFLRGPWAPLCLVALLVVTSLGPVQTVEADDTELLLNGANNPFLFIVLDTSRSMAASIDNKWLHAGADDPRSRLYIAKEVLYQELQNLTTINYGFATFNQDEVKVVSKHYLYHVRDMSSDLVDTNSVVLATMPSDLAGGKGMGVAKYPQVEPNNVIESVVAGETVVGIEGDLLTFGRTFDFVPASTTDQVVPSGTCANPLDLSSEREKINRYPKLGANGATTVTQYVEGTSNKVYRLQWKRPPLSTWTLGDQTITVTLNVAVRPGNSCADPFGQAADYTLTLELWKPFLWVDDDQGASFNPGNAGCGAANNIEMAGGFWKLQPGDVQSSVDTYPATDVCADKPFSGQGWEGNYDTGQPYTSMPTEEAKYTNSSSIFDTYCNGSGTTTTNCLNLLTRTDPSANYRELDAGDMLPFSWSSNHHTELLERLNPNHGIGPEDFGVANYFDDTAHTSGGLPLKAAYGGDRKPLVAAGNSPIGAAALDFRCWYAGENDSNKCDRDLSVTASFKSAYTTGFQDLLRKEDPSLYLCRQPYLIVVTDLHGNCTGNSKVSNIAGMFSATQDQDKGGKVANGVSSWIFNVGPGSCGGFTGAGKGSEVKISNKSDLRTELRKVIGEIQESTRAFASAAVPSVQADVADKIYFTQFTPLQNQGIWPANVDAFRKPLPTVTVDIDHDLDPNTPPIQRIVPDGSKKEWDAGTAMMAQSPDPGSLTGTYHTFTDLKIGPDENQRRVVYMVPSTTVPARRELFGPNDDNVLREDLWNAMNIPIAGLGTRTQNQVRTDFPGPSAEAHAVFKSTLIEKVWTDSLTNTFQRNYILGDVFHSNPQVLSTPSNIFYLSDPASFPGYEEFSLRLQKRRKILILGANDGMLHLFDAGRFDGTFDTGSFNDGTGKELLAYIPRDALPKLTTLKDFPDTHQWFVDGTVQLADAYIDIDRNPSPQLLKEWRTVGIGGLRRGGNSIYALDLTWPDPVQEEPRTIGGVSVSAGYVPTANNVVPACWNSSQAVTPIAPAPPAVIEDTNFPADGDCDRVPFGSVLWEFKDTTDEDFNGNDMGESWSAPDIGPIRVRYNGAEELRWVAIFGGGRDPSWASGTVGRGNWLYMVDIETGKAIYKRKLGDGSAVADPAAVDTNQDGVIDRVYIGTTEGKMWRVDMSTTPALVTSGCPMAIMDNLCIVDTNWDPEVFFDTVTTEVDPILGSVQVRKPIFFRPSVFFVGQLGGYAIGFGTGNRDKLWDAAPLGNNRFYVLADEVCNNDGSSGTLCQASSDLPIVEGDLVNITGSSVFTDVLTDPDARSTGERGWYLQLGTVPTNNVFSDAKDERMVTPSTTISGLSVFSTFVPETERTLNPGGGQGGATPSCARRGVSRSYIFLASSGESALDFTGQGPFIESDSLVSEPFLERSQTQNDGTNQSGDDPCAGQEALYEELKEEIYPKTCKFSPSFRYNLMTNLSDTGLECLVQIPVCIQQRNWKEF